MTQAKTSRSRPPGPNTRETAGGGATPGPLRQTGAGLPESASAPAALPRASEGQVKPESEVQGGCVHEVDQPQAGQEVEQTESPLPHLASDLERGGDVR